MRSSLSQNLLINPIAVSTNACNSFIQSLALRACQIENSCKWYLSYKPWFVTPLLQVLYGCELITFFIWDVSHTHCMGIDLPTLASMKAYVGWFLGRKCRQPWNCPWQYNEGGRLMTFTNSHGYLVVLCQQHLHGSFSFCVSVTHSIRLHDLIYYAWITIKINSYM